MIAIWKNVNVFVNCTAIAWIIYEVIVPLPWTELVWIADGFPLVAMERVFIICRTMATKKQKPADIFAGVHHYTQ